MKKSKASNVPKKDKVKTNCKYLYLSEEKANRNILITIGKTADMNFDGSDDVTNEILQFFVDEVIKNNKREVIILQKEQYEEENDYHYHVLVKFSSTKRASTVRNWGELLYQQYPVDIRIEKVSKITDMIGYMYKDRDHHEPIIVGDIDQTYIDSCIHLYKQKQLDNPAIERTKAMKTTRNNEQLLIYELTKFMNKHGVKINYYTRELIGMEYDDFTSAFEEEHHFVSAYGIGVLKKIRLLITDRGAHVLPEWKPDLKYIQFQDCLYNLETGLREDLNEDIVPVYETSTLFPGERPKIWLECIKRNNFKLEEFVNAYSLFYRKKCRRDKILYIWGEPETGKSTLIEPYVELFKHIVTFVSEEGNFTLGSICEFPKIIINEFNPMVLNKGALNQLKNLTEGADFNAVVKGKKQQKVEPKNVVITSNTEIETKDCFGGQDRDLEALATRVNSFQTIKNKKFKCDPSKINSIKTEAAAVAVLCTQQTPGLYINY